MIVVFLTLGVLVQGGGGSLLDGVVLEDDETDFLWHAFGLS